jgi:CRP-like cAMP-binding protein
MIALPPAGAVAMQFRNQVLAALTPAQVLALQPHLIECDFETGKVLYEPGEPIQSVYFPSTALVSVVTVMRNGRSVESLALGMESVIGVVPALADVPAHSRVLIQVGGSCWRLSATHFKALAYSDRSVMQLVLRHVHRDNIQQEQAVACNALHNVHQRLAKWLLLSEDRINSPLIPLTQEYLAIMLGVQRTSATAAATSLKKDRLIKYMRGRVEILNRPGLIRAACECYSTVTDWSSNHDISIPPVKSAKII